METTMTTAFVFWRFLLVIACCAGSDRLADLRRHKRPAANRFSFEERSENATTWSPQHPRPLAVVFLAFYQFRFFIRLP